MSNTSIKKIGLGVMSASLLALAPISAAIASESDVRIVITAEPATLDPCMTAANFNGKVALDNVYEGLTKRDPQTGKVIPSLATEWTQVDDNAWRFVLREGVTFHDGTPLNAETVKHSIDRTLNKNLSCEVRTKFFADTTVDVEVIDDQTVEITTPTWDPILPLKMTTMMIHPTSVPFDEPVRVTQGTGPYELVEWEPGQAIRLAQARQYWGEMPAVDSGEFIWRSESSVRAAMIAQGEADLAPSIAVQDIKPDSAFSYPNSETTRLNLDVLKAPLDDIRIREAINHAIDRDGLRGTIISEDAIPATQLILPQINGYNPDIELWEYNPKRARELIEEARADGVPVDTEIEFVGRIGHFPNVSEFQQSIAIMLQQVGLNVKVQWYEGIQKNRIQVKPFDPERQPQIIVDQHDNNNGDAVFTVPGRYHSDGAQAKVNDPELDSLIEKATSATGDERTETWQRAQERIASLIPDAMMFHMVGYAAINDRIAYEPSLDTNSVIRLSEIRVK